MTDEGRYHVIDIATAPTEAMRDDRGIRTLLVNRGIGANRVDVHINRIHPGDRGGRYHLHADSENVYIVLSGTGTVDVDEEPVHVRAGMVLFIPPGVPHGVRNTGEDILELYEIYAPAAPDFTEVERRGGRRPGQSSVGHQP